MIRFLRFWAVLAPATLIATAAISWGFRHIDLRYEMFVQLVTVPLIQAVVLSWATRPGTGLSFADAVLSAFTQPLARAAMVMDAGLMGGGMVFLDHPLLGFAGIASVQPTWLATKALTAAGFLLVAVARPHPDNGAWWRQRIWILMVSLFLAGAGVNGFRPWLQDWPTAIFRGDLARAPLILQWLVGYGAAVTATIAVLIQAGRRVDLWSPGAARLFDAAATCVIAAATIAVLNVFLRPYLVEPWRSVAVLLASAAISCLLVASIVAATGLPERDTGLRS